MTTTAIFRNYPNVEARDPGELLEAHPELTYSQAVALAGILLHLDRKLDPTMLVHAYLRIGGTVQEPVASYCEERHYDRNPPALVRDTWTISPEGKVQYSRRPVIGRPIKVSIDP